MVDALRDAVTAICDATGLTVRGFAVLCIAVLAACAVYLLSIRSVFVDWVMARLHPTFLTHGIRSDGSCLERA